MTRLSPLLRPGSGAYRDIRRRLLLNARAKSWRPDFLRRLEEARNQPDVVAAKAETEARVDEWRELTERLAETPATTVDGMIAKLAMIATDMDYDEDGIGGGYEGIAESAALMLCAYARS
jgi:hypothetical protein